MTEERRGVRACSLGRETLAGNACRTVPVEKSVIVADKAIMWYTHFHPADGAAGDFFGLCLEVFPRPADNEIRAGKEAFV